jgi:two-component system KDP operon response regulator KdpE
MGPFRILVVDDEPAIQRLLNTTLSAQGYQVDQALTAADALKYMRRRAPDLVLLDLGLPDQDGLDALRDLRGFSPVPVVVLTARGEEASKVAALDSGADDYVTKPFGAPELLARIRAALRHRLQQEGTAPEFHSGRLRVDLVRRIVRVEDAEVRLSPREYDMLAQFVMHAGKVLTHRHLLQHVWLDANADPQYLRVYIRQLRQKIEARPDHPELLITEPGVGYRLQVEETPPEPPRPSHG